MTLKDKAISMRKISFKDQFLSIIRESNVHMSKLRPLLDLKKAYESYAEKLDRSVESLTVQEKKQAMLDAVLEEIMKVNPKVLCACKEFKEGVAEINRFIIFASTHDFIESYTGKSFKFCPWCGNEVQDNTCAVAHDALSKEE